MRGRLVALSWASSVNAFSSTLMVSLIVNTAWTSSSRNTNAIASLPYLHAILFLAPDDAAHIDGSFFYHIALWQFDAARLLCEGIFHLHNRLRRQRLRGGANRLFEPCQQVAPQQFQAETNGQCADT